MKKTKVLDTRNNGLHRRRECTGCGFRFITTEVVLAEKPPEAKRGEQYTTKKKRAEPAPKPPKPEAKKAAINPAFTTRESLGDTIHNETKLHDTFSFALRMPPGAAARLGK